MSFLLPMFMRNNRNRIHVVNKQEPPVVESPFGLERGVHYFVSTLLGYDFTVGPRVNPEYNFEEEVAYKIKKYGFAMCTLSKETELGIARIASAIDGKLVPSSQTNSYILSLKGDYQHFKEVQDKVLNLHLARINRYAKSHKFSNVESLSYSLEGGELSVEGCTHVSCKIK